MTVVNFSEYMDTAIQQMSFDYVCPKTAFSKSENTVESYVKHPLRRNFTRHEHMFKMVTFGNGTVASVHPDLLDWCTKYLFSISGSESFHFLHLHTINQKLLQVGYRLADPMMGFIPTALPEVPDSGQFLYKWFERPDILTMDEDDRFKNALQYNPKSEYPDMLAVAALHQDEIVGIAGVSADSLTMWQIGVDVMQAFRGHGLASYLVSALAQETVTRQALPYYCTRFSNIPSQRVALRCGFVPVWSEVYAIPIQ